jgi:hypothetical protein
MRAAVVLPSAKPQARTSQRPGMVTTVGLRSAVVTNDASGCIGTTSKHRLQRSKEDLIPRDDEKKVSEVGGGKEIS